MSFITSADREYMRQQSLPYYVASIDADMSSDLEVNYIGLVDRPAIERNFQAFKAITQRARFTVDEEKHVISGPAMIADMPIYRNDAQLGEYYVVFDKPSIRSIVEKFSAKGYLFSEAFRRQQRTRRYRPAICRRNAREWHRFPPHLRRSGETVHHGINVRRRGCA